MSAAPAPPRPGTASPLLQLSDLQAGYGANQVLFGLSMTVNAGEVVTLLGRNGMGKSTTVKCLSGLLAPRSGSVKVGGIELAGQRAWRIAQAGIGLVPEGRQVFPTLTVRENLLATASLRHAGAQPWTMATVHQLFPRLDERGGHLAAQLSGGEQQMLAIGRALMTNPRLLVLDEATEGLAPLVRAEIWRCLGRLKAQGQAMIVIDKHLRPLLPLADRHYLIHRGQGAWQGSSDELAAQPQLMEQYIGV